ncbi:hypothetical protein [Candidatus Enterococcus huntleyi]|uniref:hypothetical protein n=1 Tax=Candidatus Enterococcus huntleyi TaxID=1857217 RepID=UPI00137AC5E9|nr:hypothetical protein [Enterococcus sp. JM4C]
MNRFKFDEFQLKITCISRGKDGFSLYDLRSFPYLSLFLFPITNAIRHLNPTTIPHKLHKSNSITPDLLFKTASNTVKEPQIPAFQILVASCASFREKIEVKSEFGKKKR